VVHLREVNSTQLATEIAAFMNSEHSLQDASQRSSLWNGMRWHTRVEKYAIASGVISLIPFISAFDSFWLAAYDRASSSRYSHLRPADGLHKIVIPICDHDKLAIMKKESINTHPKESLTPEQTGELVPSLNHALIIQDSRPRARQRHIDLTFFNLLAITTYL